MKRYLNIVLIIIMILLDSFYITKAIINTSYEKLPTYLVLFPILLVPLLLEKITKKNLTQDLKLIYFLFIFLADCLGCIVGLYNSTLWFDKLAHFLSGVFTAFLAIILMNYFEYKKNKIGSLIYILGFTCLIAVIWEFFEYGMDTFFKTNLQHTNTSGVKDTMNDLISAFLGSLLFLGLYFKNKIKIKVEKFIT